jgi:RimJ/RimL family protein N-acetyltransferase
VASLDNPASIKVLTKLGMTLVREEMIHYHVQGIDQKCGIFELRLAQP